LARSGESRRIHRVEVAVCGIAGFSGSFPETLLHEMVRIISHRGPDANGIWSDRKSGIGLGHARLSIIDLSAEGGQPMTNEDGTIWLSYNGELYNYRSLRDDMLARGHKFRSMTDSEVLIHLYEEFGVDMLRKLNGVFAFAIWDGRTKELFLARDHLGVKPLYFSKTNAGVLFSSELKALLAFDGVSRQIDAEAVHQYLTFLWAPAPRTMLKNISKLPPGNALLIKDGCVLKEWNWYKIPYDGSRLAESEDAVAAMLADKLRLAVERQLMADVPVGAFLSGGLDSSSIVAMMRRILPQADVSCYCIGFEDEKEIEGCPLDLPYARKVARHLGVRLNEIVVKPEDMIKRLAELIYFLDEPQADPAPINAMFIAERARADGVKVLLSGAGGDDIFSGYRRHLAVRHLRLFNLIPAAFRKLISKFSAGMGNQRNPWFRKARKFLSGANLSAEEHLVDMFKWSSDETRFSLLSDNFKNRVSGKKPERALFDSLSEIPNEPDLLNRMLYLECKHFLADHNLNYTDKTTMRYGVETRVPLLDIDLVEFAAKIPPEFKQKSLVGKAIFKKAMEPYLPHDVIYRKKTGFGVPLRKWINEDLRSMMDETLSSTALRNRGIFDPKGVKKLIDDDRAGFIDGAYTILAVLSIELWCRIFIDGKSFQNAL